MPFSGTTYSLVAGNPVVTGTTISSTWANNTLNDIASALTTAYSAAQTGAPAYLTGTAGTNTITATATPTITAYTTGQRFVFVPAVTNTGATTINISSLGAKNIFNFGVACIGGELRASIPAEIEYDGTQFHILGNANRPRFVSATEFGATRASSDAQNLTAVQAGITAVNAAGGGALIVDGGIDYGFILTDPSTYPSFSSATTDIAAIDYGAGMGHPTYKQGAQVRHFFYTEPSTTAITFTASLSGGATSATLTGNWTEESGPYTVIFSNDDERNVTFTNGATTATWTDGLSSGATANAAYEGSAHNGNGQEIHAEWHPHLSLYNDSQLAAAGAPSRTQPDNYRASIIFGTNGYTRWRLAQGSTNGYNKTIEELTDFVLEFFTQTGDTIVTNDAPLLIQRSTLNWSLGSAVSVPETSFHFKSPVTGFFQALFHNPFATTSTLIMRPSGGSGDDVYFRSDAGDAVVRIASTGDAIRVTKATRRTILISSGRIIATPTYSTSITPDSAAGEIQVITATDGVNFAINAAANQAAGAFMTVTIKNTSGGALGTVSWAAVYKMAAWTSPATGFSRSITFYNEDATNWREVSRDAADIPN